MTFFVAAVLVLAILWLLKRLVRSRKQSLRQQWKLYGLLAAAVLLLLLVTKKWHVLSLLVAGVIPFIRQVAPLAVRFAPFLHQQFQRYRFQKPPPNQHNSQQTAHQARTQNGNDQTSASVTTQLFHMTLDPHTGKITGAVRQGPFAGRAVETLDLTALRTLHAQASQCQDDSCAVFEAFLQNQLGQNWHQQLFEAQDNAHSAAPSGGPMTTEEAWEILGLSPGAPREQIISRHKSLIQKLHPDRGGSNYLTVRINQARDLLLKKKSA